MQMIGLARLGRDAELRTTPNGDPVANLSLAFNYGQKGPDGRPTQWIDASLWGKRAEVLIDYLVKGQQVVVTLDDPHIETYQGRNGEGHKLAAKVSAIELAGGKPQQSDAGQPAARAPAPAPAPRPAPAPAPRSGGGGFGPDDDDIPFAPMRIWW